MNLLLMFNPHAGGGRAHKRLSAICDRLESAGIQITVVLSQYCGHIEQQLREIDLEKFDVVAVAGGDGTLSQAVNGMMAHAEEARKPIGLIPVGTGNAFARDIGLQPDDWQAGVDLIIRRQTRRVDVGRIQCPSETFYFLNIAGLGFVTDAGLTAAKLKFAGQSAYTLATLWRCLKLRSHALELEVDGQRIIEDNLFVEVSNSRYTGTHFLIAPSAKIDDGLLDVISVRRLSRFRLLRLFPSVFKGEHVHYAEVTSVQGRNINIRSPKGLVLTVDGEFRGETPARIECLAGAIKMISD